MEHTLICLIEVTISQIFGQIIVVRVNSQDILCAFNGKETHNLKKKSPFYRIRTFKCFLQSDSKCLRFEGLGLSIKTIHYYSGAKNPTDNMWAALVFGSWF